MTGENPLVFVVGATGWTGTSIVQGLLKSGNFRIAALIRPASVVKPATQQLEAQGVEIRVGDIADGVEELTEALTGVDIIVSCVVPWLVHLQKDLFIAAKAAGTVKRVVPCDFASAGAPGVRALHDVKLAVREHVQQLGLGHTFVDVGWWMQLYLPLPLRSAAGAGALKMSRHVYGAGDSRTLLTDLGHVGTYVARIIADPRTLGRDVQVWEDERTQLEAREIGERVSCDGDALKVLRVPVTREELEQWREEGRAAAARDPTDATAQMKQGMSEYMLHLHFLQENTLENVTRLGYLDARALYPDIPRHTLEEYAEEFYMLPEPGVYLMREQEIKLP
ncbi:NAD-P-binding protein [Ganoderma leucocontextum]|nr:NAD-P-binding protein [Ganoderma leucocontextum]